MYTPTTNVWNACFPSLSRIVCYQTLDFCFICLRFIYISFNSYPLSIFFWVTGHYLLISSGPLYMKEIILSCSDMKTWSPSLLFLFFLTYVFKTSEYILGWLNLLILYGFWILGDRLLLTTRWKVFSHFSFRIFEVLEKLSLLCIWN